MRSPGDPAPSEPPAGDQCDRCGRVVRETRHGRGAYTVDAFRLYTGPTEPAIVRRPDSDEVLFVYQRLIRPVVLVTCADCYADPARRRQHQTWSYPSP